MKNSNSQPINTATYRRPLLKLARFLILPIPEEIATQLGLTDENHVQVEVTDNGFRCTVERERQDEI